MASKSLSESADGEEAVGRSSAEQSDPHGESQMKKSESRIMRELATREDVNSTSSLVKAYNQAESEEESKSLHQWLQRYSPYLDPGFARHAEGGIFNEMSYLAGIKPRCEEDNELIRKTIRFLGQQITDISLDQCKTVGAFAAALDVVDESVFNGDPALLLKLSNVLLGELDITQTAFIGAASNTHNMILFALYQTLLLVQSIAEPVAHGRQKQLWFQTVKTKLKNIADCQSHFPFFFQVKIVEQCLARLVMDSAVDLRDVPRRMMPILSGFCDIYSSVRKALTADIDLDRFMKGYKKIKKASADRGNQRGWYDEFLKLNGAALLSSESADFDNDFMPCVQEAMEAQANFTRREDTNLLRFGIVAQLSYASLHGKSETFCTGAMTELVSLATRFLTYEGWDMEPAIIDAVLVALQEAHSSSSLQEMAVTAVLCMTTSESQSVRVSFDTIGKAT